MGMDVIGKNPTTETGEYFRNNVWAWRPLWDYCCEVGSDLFSDPTNGHFNDGYGLDGQGAEILATRLRGEIAAGNTAQYEREYNAHLASLPRHTCQWCNGTGIRTDEVGVDLGFPSQRLAPEIAAIVGREAGYCNGCSGEGLCDHPDTSYGFWADNVAEFAAFLADSGGFEIW